MVRAAWLAVALLVTPTLACDKSRSKPPAVAEDPIDQQTRELLDALAHGDQNRAAALCNPTLAAELDERTVATLGRTLTWLGPISSLAHERDTPLTAGVERRYQVEFERESVTLTVTVTNDKLEGFEFDPDQWNAVSERAQQASVGALRLASFELVNLAPADVRYDLSLAGLGAELREHHVTIAKRVLDPDGNVVYRQTEDDDVRFPQAETGSDGGTIHGTVAVPGPGRYTLELMITDEVEVTTMTHQVEFTVE